MVSSKYWALSFVPSAIASSMLLRNSINIPDVLKVATILDLPPALSEARIDSLIIKETFPSDSYSYFNLAKAVAAHAELNFPKATDLYSLALKNPLVFSEANLGLSVIRWFSTNNADGFIADTSKVLVREPNNSLALCLRAIALRQGDRLYEALVDIDVALRTSPNDVECLIERGNILDTAKKFDEAMSCYGKALALGSGLID